MLLTADGVGTNEIIRRTAKSRPAFGAGRIAFWRTRFDGLVRDKTRPS